MNISIKELQELIEKVSLQTLPICEVEHPVEYVYSKFDNFIPLDWNKGELNPMFGKTHSSETKAQISLAKRGKCSEALLKANRKSGKAKRGISPSLETKNKISTAQKGKVMTEEHKSNLSKAGRGRPVSEETREKLRLKNSEKSTCPHCGKRGGGSAMKRYHFDNCSTLRS